MFAVFSSITQPTVAAGLNNCAFVSTADLALEPERPFCFLMDAAMLGVGVGFDTDGAGSVIVVGKRHVNRRPA
jgi:ribonucleoside-triphosphate reductase (thioredoxin)